MYDKEFRMHVSNFPQRSWAVILQQAWSMYLKDRIQFGSAHKGDGNQKGNRLFSKEVCKRFNKGKCMNGNSCKYDHRCEYCGKFGHGAHICRKRLNKNNSQDGSSNSSAVQESSK